MANIFSFLTDGELRKLRAIMCEIEELRPNLYNLSDEQLRAKTIEFRERLDSGETLDDLMVEAFAVVREAARRTVGMEHFPVQLMGGIVLHRGAIAEMQTGEGKTLVATLPAYLNALPGKGVHVVTVNDYLAKRDRELMGCVHEFLGLTVDTVLPGMNTSERKKAYSADITYLTNSELGFDYLRDNMAKTTGDLVQRGLYYAIIDEVDSVLIDDARTPLIISSELGKTDKIYEASDVLAKLMERGADLPELTRMDRMAGVQVIETGDYVVMEKDNRVMLTAKGIDRVERFFRIENIADPENARIMNHMELALRANYLMERDKDYLVKDNEIFIIDPNTGRVMAGRRYSDGLHQAIEAKERVTIQPENQTVASITYQSLFNKYEKHAGMTGTGRAEEAEFRDTYQMGIIAIPTNKPVVRIDQDDIMYRTRAEKNEAICDQVCESYAAHRPVLVGTTSVIASEEISQLLCERHIPHNVLNAKNHELEATIVAEAGKCGAVTIATNMAGRGTDIKLDDDARKAGGLLVIGSERHESSRIDGQLRGRSGRQGDPGESQFYLSLDDELLRLFGGKRLAASFDAAKVQPGVGVSNSMFTKAIEQAQRAIEGTHYEQRKQLRKFDEVVNKQREVIYSQRRQVLETDDVRSIILAFLDAVVADSVALAEDSAAAIAPFENLLTPGKVRYLLTLENAALEECLLHDLETLYDDIEESFTDHDYLYERARLLILEIVDDHWKQHVDNLEQLRLGIGLVSYANLDPVTEYQRMSSELFEKMCREIRIDVITYLLETTKYYRATQSNNDHESFSSKFNRAKNAHAQAANQSENKSVSAQAPDLSEKMMRQ